MFHLLGHMVLWHAVGRAMHGLTYLEAALLAVVVIVVMFSVARRRRW